MTTAFVLGNGRSRLSIDPEQLKKHGPVYACNAIYRTFTPDVLVATDTPIAEEIQNSGYAQKNVFYTRSPIEGLGARILDKKYRGNSSGPNAVALACIDGHSRIFMLGFDLGTTNGQFNNVYADTQFYKKSTSPPTFAGNWINQIRTLTEDFPSKQFIRVIGPESAHIPGLVNLKNLEFMDIAQFRDLLNTEKGLL